MKLDLKEILSFGNLEFLAKQLVEGFITGLHRSPYHGFSVEFAEHRLYNTGESTRHIDWKIFAKTDKLFTKRYEEETNLRCHILIDTSSSMYYPQEDKGKITFSIMGAAAICWMLQGQRDAVGLSTFSNQLGTSSPIKSTKAHIHSLILQLEQLLNSESERQTTLVAPVLHELADRTPRRSLVIIFSDMLDQEEQEDDIFHALQHLKHNNHEVVLFHTLESATEENFQFEERPYEFIDLETGEKLKIQPSEVRESYKKIFSEKTHRLKLKCGQFKIDYVPCDIRGGWNQVLLSYLIKRHKMAV